MAVATSKRSRTRTSNHGAIILSLAAEDTSLKGTDVTYVTQRRTEKPQQTAFSNIIKQCRYLMTESDFLNQFLPFKESIYNFGLSYVPGPDPGTGELPNDAQNKELESWLNQRVKIQFEDYEDPTTKTTITPELIMSNRGLLDKFVRDAWMQWFLLDIVVASWIDGQGFASLLPPEKTEFTDVCGVPILKYTHGLSAQDIKKLPSDIQDRYSTNQTILFDPKAKEHFVVLKRARVGDGYGIPRLYSIFTLLGEIESKQVGMNGMAFGMRKVTRLHKLGHSIDGGPLAGKPFHFFKKKRAEAIQKGFKDKTGFADFFTNFDHDISYPWPDLKVFDKTAFEGSNERLNNWAGPLMQMILASGNRPYLSPVLRAIATEERRELGEMLNNVLNDAYKPPVPVQVVWSNIIFQEARLAAELLKFAQTVGWVSTETAQEQIGYSAAQENERKLREATDTDARKKLLPLWDASHGIAPALGETTQKPPSGADPNGPPNGRPPGSTTT